LLFCFKSYKIIDPIANFVQILCKRGQSRTCSSYAECSQNYENEGRAEPVRAMPGAAKIIQIYWVMVMFAVDPKF